MTIAQKAIRILLGMAVLLAPGMSKASEDHKGEEAHAAHGVVIEGKVDTHEEVKAYMEHHLQDAHDFVLFTDGETGKHYGFSLPVIVWDNGLKMFSSSKFHHGDEIAEVDGNFYAYHHSKIYKVDSKDAQLTFDEHGHPLEARLLDFSITKNVVGMLIAAVLLLIGFVSLARGYKKSLVPTGVGRFLEPLVIYVRDEIAIPNIGQAKYRKYMSFLLTVFFFVLVLNLLGLTPFGFGVTNNIAVTTCFAVFTFIIVNFTANKDYWKHIFWMPGVPVPMKIILAPIEVLGMFTKPFSLLVRMFANLTAGHMVLMSLIALAVLLKAEFGAVASTGVSFILSLFITLIELLVAYLQAFIFTMLSALFIGAAVQEHDHAHH